MTAPTRQEVLAWLQSLDAQNIQLVRCQTGAASKARIAASKGYDRQLVINRASRTDDPTDGRRLFVMDGVTNGGHGVVMQFDLPFGADDIADGAITAAKINSNALGDGLAKSGGKIVVNVSPTGGLSFSNGALQVEIPDGSITTAKLADNAVTSVKIKDGEVKTADLDSGAVTFAKVASSAIASTSEAAAGTATNKLVTPAGLAAALAAAGGGGVGRIQPTIETGTGYLQIGTTLICYGSAGPFTPNAGLVSVTFPRAFTSVPKVFTTTQPTTGDAAWSRESEPYNITVSGCYLRTDIYSPGGGDSGDSTYLSAIVWLAIGERTAS